MNIFAGGIAKTGEGYDRPEESIPIDLQYNKIIDWLIDRKKLSPQWRKDLATIHSKITAAIKDLPQTPEIVNLLQSKAEIDYFDIENIMELLKQAGESDSKTLFGQYSSKRMKEWHDIMKSYEKDNIHLAEAANTLITIVNYEIPAIRKTMDHTRKQISDLDRKQSEWERNANQYQQKFKKSCEDLKIEGKNIREELMGLVTEIPNLLEKVAQKAQQQGVTDAMNFYKDFINYTLNGKSVPLDNLLPTLKWVSENGLGKKFTKEAETRENPATEPKAASLEIDWTVIDTANEAQKDNNSLDESKLDSSAINWDISVVDEPAVVQGEQPNIIWDYENPDVSIEVVDAATESVIEMKSNEDNSLFLDITENRTKFMNDLVELRDFLTQRLDDLTAKDNSTVIDLTQGAPSFIQEQSIDKLKQWKSIINDIILSLESPKLKMLLEIKNSKRYVDRTVASYHHLLECIEKCNSSVVYAKNKKQELQDVFTKGYPHETLLINQVKEIKPKITQLVSKMYNNRIVNIYCPY